MVGRAGPALVISVLVRPGSIRSGALVALSPDELHHLEVRRVSPDEPVRVMDGQGVTGIGGFSGQGVLVDSVQEHVKPPVLRLAVGAGDRDRFGWLVEKCAELPVAEIVPVLTRHAVAVGSRVRPAHLDKLRRKALEAIKQSGNPFAPRVSDLVELNGFAEQCRSPVRLVAAPEGAAPGPVSPAVEVSCLIGPEGGFSEEERAALERAGFQPLRLGPYILRFETAAIAAAVALTVHRA